MAIFGIIGQIGPILGSRLFPTSQGPHYSKGMAVCAGLLLAAAAITQGLSLSMRWQYRKRDQRYGKVDRNSVPEDVADVGDEHPSFRYIL